MNKDTLKDLEERISNHSIINTPLESFKLMYDLLKYNLETLNNFSEFSNEIQKVIETIEISYKILDLRLKKFEKLFISIISLDDEYKEELLKLNDEVNKLLED